MRVLQHSHYGNISHEILVIGAKGWATPTCDPKITTKVSSVQSIKKTAHSAKPVEYYSIIEKLYPDRKYIELFSRAEMKQKGWTH